MDNIAEQRCFNHRRREAAARCLECLRFFCKECVTEHDDRVICASCLRKLGAGRSRHIRSRKGLALAVRCLAGFIMLWLVFYALGRCLLRLPSSFHEGNLWRNLPWESL